MAVAAAILLGICAGVVGFLPLRFALVSYRKVLGDNSTMRLAAYSLVAFLVSLVLVVVALVICSQVAHDLLLPFGVTEIFALIVVTSVYVVRKNRTVKQAQPGERGRDIDG